MATLQNYVEKVRFATFTSTVAKTDGRVPDLLIGKVLGWHWQAALP